MPLAVPRQLEQPSGGNGRSKLHSVRRVGVIDVGSNSVRMVVFDGAARSPAYFYNEKIMCGLGSELSQTGRLAPGGQQRALAALRRFALLARDMRLTSLICVATAAVREAADGKAFCRDVRKATGLTLAIAGGREEARLAAQGVMLGWPDADGVVCDIGGSSVELGEVGNRQVGHRVSAALGPLMVNRVTDCMAERAAHISREVSLLRTQFRLRPHSLYLVGGCCRVFARLDMERRQYPLRVLNEYRMSRGSVLATVEWIADKDPEDLRVRARTSPERIHLVMTAALILESLVTEFRPQEISVSGYGIREGLLYDRMPKRLRARDPLIEACIHAERSSARLPGRGNALFKFIKPLFRTASKERLRLIRAACLLHDVTWRAHPDYRAEICFDNATRANLGGLDHPGRVFLALALFHRYKNYRHDSRLCQLTTLLSPDDAGLAEIVGRAMRFGAMLAVASSEMIGSLRHQPRKGNIILSLPAAAQDIFGEVVEARFHALARAMDCKPSVQVERSYSGSTVAPAP